MEMIKKNSDLKKVYRARNSIANRILVMYILPNEFSYSRSGLSISKKIGNAVMRNKIKRQLKEILRLNENKIKKGYDIILIARNGINKATYVEIENSVFHLINKKNLQI